MMDAPLCRNLSEVRSLAQAMDRAQVENYEMRIPQALKDRHNVVGIAQAVRFGACRAFHAAIGADKKGKEMLLRVRLTWRPGVRVARAVAEDRTEELSVDEMQILQKARRILPKDILSWPEIERERWIHDWLCKNIVYRGAADELSDNIYDRNCSAIGAMLDGQANCQGYSDAFYMLGSLAGLTVNIQIGSERSPHAWNVIRLGGRWYILDVTFNDSASEPLGVPFYHVFNVPITHVKGLRDWDRGSASVPVTETSEEMLFHHRWACVSDDWKTLARYCAEQARKGEKFAWGLYTGGDCTDDCKEFRAALHELVPAKHDNFATYPRNRNGRCYILVQWNEEKPKQGKK